MAEKVIDCHSHVLVEEAEEFVRRLKVRYPSGSGRDFQGEESREVNRARFPSWRVKLANIEEKLSDMDRLGIDVSVLSASPLTFHNWVEGEEGVRIARMQNEGMARMVRSHPGRFAALATLPMQEVPAALEELERAVGELGHRGAMVQTNFRGRDLDHPVFDPFFKKVVELDVPLFLHPHDVAGAERFQDYYLTNLIGNPLDTTIAVTRMIFGGVFERHPSLKVCLVHGGGQFPFIRGRLDHGYAVRPEVRKHAPRPPSAYLRQIYLDTVTFFDPALRYLIETVGEDHVLLGSDYPFDMADEECVARVKRVVPSPEARAQILGGNCARLLKL